VETFKQANGQIQAIPDAPASKEHPRDQMFGFFVAFNWRTSKDLISLASPHLIHPRAGTMAVPGVGDNSVHAVQFSILFNGLLLLLFLALFEAGLEKVGKLAMGSDLNSGPSPILLEYFLCIFANSNPSELCMCVLHS
jgi:hypothetical protein